MLLDFHSHILPNVDDGSHSVEESLGLLGMLKEQDVEIVVATPHFDVNRQSLSSFLKRRSEAYEQLKKGITFDMPRVILGAEVVYYSDIGRLEDLHSLCIEGTNLLLLEMPMAKWSNYTVNELINMISTRNIRVIIAHVERCLRYQNKESIKLLCENDVLFQINASLLTNPLSRRRGLTWLKKGIVQVLGSDCHNLITRPPRIKKAFDVIKNCLGNGFVCEMLQFEKNLLK